MTVRFRTVTVLFLVCLDDFAPCCSQIGRGNSEAFKDAVDFACVFGTDEHVGMAVRVRLILEDAVQDAVLLGLPTELFQFIVAHGKHLEFFSAPEHTGKPRFAARLFLILQDRIEKNSQPLRSFTADLCGDLNPVQGHSHDLFCRLS